MEDTTTTATARRVTAPPAPLPSALQTFINCVEAVAQTASIELPSRHYEAFVSVAGKRFQQRQRELRRAA
jgi:hypothetical protein